MKISLPILACALTLPSCKIVDVPEFVHPSTQGIREDLRWESPAPKLPSGLHIEGAALLVPDFTKFWPGYSATGSLYICTHTPEEIEIESVLLSAPDTGEKKEINLKRLLTPKLLADSVWLIRERIIEHDVIQVDEFIHAKRLVLVVRWRVAGETDMKESRFEFELRTRKDIAWPT